MPDGRDGFLMMFRAESLLSWKLVQPIESAPGRVRIEVNQTYALKDAAQAHADLAARRTTGSTGGSTAPAPATPATPAPAAST